LIAFVYLFMIGAIFSPHYSRSTKADQASTLPRCRPGVQYPAGV